MKHRLVILASPFVFVLAAAMASFSEAPAGNDSAGGDSIPRSPPQRASVTIDSGGIPAALRHMESRILAHNPAPPRKSFNAEEMEEVIDSNHSGRFPIEYCMAWADEAPEEMFAWLVRQNQTRSFYAYILFESWTKRDIATALDSVFNITDSKIRAQALISSLEVLCISNPERARELLAQNLGLFPPDGESLCFRGIGSGKAFLDLLVSLPPCVERTHLLAGLLGNTSISSDAVDYWNGLPDSGRRELLAAGFAPYMTSAGAFDGLADLMRDRAESTNDPELIRKFIECHGESWAEQDLAGALDWAQTHLKGRNRVVCRENFFQSAIRRNFEGTIRIWQTLPEGFLKASAADAIVRATPESRRAAAEALLKSP